jgi:hypothetical protein
MLPYLGPHIIEGLILVLEQGLKQCFMDVSIQYKEMVLVEDKLSKLPKEFSTFRKDFDHFIEEHYYLLQMAL